LQGGNRRQLVEYADRLAVPLTITLPERLLALALF